VLDLSALSTIVGLAALAAVGAGAVLGMRAGRDIARR
jgi:hypothetical protein